MLKRGSPTLQINDSETLLVLKVFIKSIVDWLFTGRTIRYLFLIPQYLFDGFDDHFAGLLGIYNLVN